MDNAVKINWTVNLFPKHKIGYANRQQTDNKCKIPKYIKRWESTNHVTKVIRIDMLLNVKNFLRKTHPLNEFEENKSDTETPDKKMKDAPIN